MELLIAFGVGWLLMGVFGGWVASQKNRSGGEGFALGLLFGPFGVLIEALLPTAAAKQAAGLAREKRGSGGDGFDDESEPQAVSTTPAPPRTFRVEGENVTWRCACGRPREAKLRLAGKVAPCPTCKRRTIVPGLPA